MTNLIALNTYLEVFKPYFAMGSVTDICINRPKEIWVEQEGRFTYYEVPELNEEYLWQFAQLVAEANQREITPENPTLSATLPNGLRVQFVVEPACERGLFICAIRQKAVKTIVLSQYFAQDACAIQQSQLKKSLAEEDKLLLADYKACRYESFFRRALLAKKNIIISGGTGTGKTTFLNSLLQVLPLEERILTIETDREVFSKHRNTVHLLSAEEGQGVAAISMLNLLKAALRLRPDRILVSEIRDYSEAYPYLRAINSGHPGSMTTIHADSPASCFDQLALMMLQGGSRLTHRQLVDYAKAIINVVIQIKRGPTGKRYISEIYYDQAA